MTSLSLNAQLEITEQQRTLDFVGAALGPELKDTFKALKVLDICDVGAIINLLSVILLVPPSYLTSSSIMRAREWYICSTPRPVLAEVSI